MEDKQRLVKVFIVDDNAEAIMVLRLMLEKNYSVRVVGTANDAETAVEDIVKTEPNLIFLDVELPTMSGLDFCTLILNKISPETKVVFYTGHDKYMLDAIRRQAFDYLLKPPTEQDLSQIMTRYYEEKLATIPQISHSENSLPVILVVNALNEHMTLRLLDIAFFRYNQERKLWETICTNNTIYMLRHRTTADVILRYTADFVQIHKRYIVNINIIKKIQDSICILQEPLDNIRELRISKNYRQNFMAAFYSM